MKPYGTIRFRGALVTTLVLALAATLAPRAASAQDELPPLQGKTEKLAREASGGVVALGETLQARWMKRRLTHDPSMTEQLDGQSSGAGFVIDEEGDILTCSNMVEGSARVDVTFPGGHKTKAKLIAQDARNRVALLRLEDAKAAAKALGGKLPVLKLGKSAGLARGRVVATVGNAFESLQVDGAPAFSLGIVSAIGRIRDPDAWHGFAIETDAAVNPGSFGGPLVDLEGRVVGVVVEAISPKRWLGVAVPIDQVALGLDDLKNGRSPRAPWLGLSVVNASEPSLSGLLVDDVDQSGPCGKAGVKKGDRLLTLDGAKIAEAYDIEHELQELAQGSPVELQLERAGKPLKLTVTLGSGTAEVAQTSPEKTPEKTPAKADEREKTGPKTSPTKGWAGLNVKDEGGVTVSQVVEDGPAARAGIKLGDKVVSVDGKAVKSRQDVIDAISAKGVGDKVALRLERDGWKKEVELVLGARPGEKAPDDKGEKDKPKKRAFLGVALMPQDDEDAEGLVVAQVAPDSPAAKAKLAQGDIVKEIDGKKLEASTDWRAIINAHRPGDTLKIVFSHEGKDRKADVVLAEREAPPSQPGTQDEPEKKDEPKGSKAWIGIAFEEKDGKLVVDDVAEEGPGARAKVQKGLVLAGIKTGEKLEKFSSIDALAKVLDGKKAGETVMFVFEKDGWSKNIEVTLEPRPEGK